MIAHFGQFLDHDFGLTLEEEGECCPVPHSMSCFNIKIDKKDPFYSKRGKDCHSFLRSAACARTKDFCGFHSKTLEQINGVTHLIGTIKFYCFVLPLQTNSVKIVQIPTQDPKALT